ncbi:hypothetical protein CMUS01_10905 [Colletotrichum musicola]|uniref:Uncharacterized protein n=1 Tax=Colletotrichum musicola TaxID=2175873 RepID=A0A8H6K1T9_9PEZI|nr:hypothetical protein CMUS01_10905 [Colletotrichum musicola]
MGGAPMGWRYLMTGLWEDRWEDEHVRDEKLLRIF